jgi:hypothetical protein
LFEFDGEVDADNLDVGGEVEGDGGEIEDAFDVGGDEGVGDFLGGGAGDGDDGEADAAFMHDAGHVGEVENGDAIDGRADFGGVVVEGGRDAEALVLEAAIAKEGAAEVAESDHGERPGLVGAEDAFDGVDQLVTAIADAGVAELAEVGQVFADLSVCKAKELAELRGAGGFVAVADQVLQLAEVEAEAADNGFGDRQLGRGLVGSVFAFGHRAAFRPPSFGSLGLKRTLRRVGAGGKVRVSRVCLSFLVGLVLDGGQGASC